MEKKNFISLIMGTVGGILFAIGMCMCLLPQWNAFNQGVVISVIGLTVREFNLIYKLLSYPKKTFTRSQLMDEFWDSSTSSGS